MDSNSRNTMKLYSANMKINKDKNHNNKDSYW